MSRTETLSTAEEVFDRPRVIVLGYGDLRGHSRAGRAAAPVIAANADIVLWDLAFAESLEQVDADLAIVFGGDGSILRHCASNGVSPSARRGGQPW